jgi:PiT family inorganic phosphate transporter
MNGFHDGANSIATIVATGVLTPKQAVLFAAFFNFAALWVFQLKVAATIGKGTSTPRMVDHYVIFGALMGALIWNIITWYYGIPSSSSHALIGGLVGATVAKAGGADAHRLERLRQDPDLHHRLAALVGFLIGGLLMVLVAWVFRNRSPYQAGKWFKSGQLFAAAAYSLGHGGNDAQKTIGIIWLLLITAGASTTDLEDPAHVGGLRLLWRHRLGHLPGRLAHRQDHGHEDHQAQLGQRLLRVHGRRDQPGPGHAGRHPGVHHAHHHRRHRRRRAPRRT